MVGFGVTKGYIEVIRDMHDGAVTTIRSPVGETSEFPITVGLHQGSALSPYLFALVMDELTRQFQEDIPWCMMFADDIILVDETARGVNTKLEALESKGFRISRSKTEYMVCKFSGTSSALEERVMIQDQEIPKSDHFRRDRIRNETVREMVGVAHIEEKLRENRLRWFRHVYRRPGDAVVKRADMIVLGSNATGRGRPKLTLDAVVRKDLSIVEGLCKLLNQNRETLKSLEFVHCKLSSTIVDTICDSLYLKDLHTHTVERFSIKTSSFLETNQFPLPVGLASFLSSARGNNLRKDDAACLKNALVHMPNLENLDISDNPLEDDGIMILIPYFVEMSEKHSPIKDLKVESCELSCGGVSQLLSVLSTLTGPLNSLSIGGNDLGSKVGAPLGKFLGTGIRALDIEDIELGPSGFLELQEEIIEDLKLVYINISKNRGGNEAAKFLTTLIPRAPELVALNAGYNFMPSQSLLSICSVLKVAKGKLEHVDLTGNNLCAQSADATMLAEFQKNGNPIFLLPTLPASNAPYDDDP
ncbi:hypothetical protein RHMOL_Rhmol13G0051900 [Rhododendron molle]|uniref:Uncharacterized protein n=1 Tax=Rhododendron molle TaxID=49168 RepID=A0ACC0L457_RHOML|nr:hypothetical protein RHMOL_Rhmol13G0051900 [Rhododendron molle]